MDGSPSGSQVTAEVLENLPRIPTVKDAQRFDFLIFTYGVRNV